MVEDIDRKYIQRFLAEELQGNKNLFKTLLGHFVKHLKNFIEFDCGDEQRFPQIMAAGHRLKSSCRSLGALNLGADLEQMEIYFTKGNISEALNCYKNCSKTAKRVLIDIENIKQEFRLNDEK